MRREGVTAEQVLSEWLTVYLFVKATKRVLLKKLKKIPKAMHERFDNTPYGLTGSREKARSHAPFRHFGR
jgi:hypothetical protein